jgi:hypothetical protein
MGWEQYLLAHVFLGSYVVALGEFAGARGRLVGLATAALAAVGFAAFSDAWEVGVILVAFAVVGIGLLSGAAWTLWTVATWRDRDATRLELTSVECAPRRVATRPREHPEFAPSSIWS